MNDEVAGLDILRRSLWLGGFLKFDLEVHCCFNCRWELCGMYCCYGDGIAAEFQTARAMLELAALTHWRLFLTVI